MNNNNTLLLKNQLPDKKDFRSEKGYLTALLYYFERCCPAMLGLINNLIKYGNIYRRINPSQAKLAHNVATVRHVNRLLKKLVEWGVLTKIYNHRKTCEYILHPLFYDYSWRHTMAGLLSNLRWIPQVLHLSFLLVNTTLARSINTFQFAHVIPSSYEEKREEKRKIHSHLQYVSNEEKERGYQVNSQKQEKVTVFLKKEKKSMNAPEIMQQVTKELALTDAGRAKISIFTEAALRHSLNELEKQRLAPFQRYHWFFAECKRYSTLHNLKIDWTHHRRVTLQVGNAPLFDVKKISQQKGMTQASRPQVSTIAAPSKSFISATQLAREISTLINEESPIGSLDFMVTFKKDAMVRNRLLEEYKITEEPSCAIADKYLRDLKEKHGIGGAAVPEPAKFILPSQRKKMELAREKQALQKEDISDLIQDVLKIF